MQPALAGNLSGSKTEAQTIARIVCALFYTGKGGIAIEHFHLPTAFEVYSDERKAGFLKVKAAEKEGKRVAGCFRAFTTLAILDAAGQIDTRIAAFLETLGE